MKKKILSLVIIIVSVIIVVEGYYYGHILYAKYKAKKPIQEAISSLNIPKEEIHVINDNNYEDAKGGGWVITTITTKKDYQNWKRIVLKQGHYLDFHADKLNKKSLNQMKNCELTYDFIYDPKTKKVNIDYVVAGNSAAPSQMKYFNYQK